MTDKVRCAICDAEMSAINNRHLAKHAITAQQYKERFPSSPMMTEQSTKKLSDRSIKSNESRKGVPRSEETKQKMRDALAKLPQRARSGPMCEEQKELLSSVIKQQYAVGRVHPNTGKHLAEETKQKIAQTLIDRNSGPMLKRLEQANLILLNEDEHHLHLQCKTCGHIFYRHVQRFYPAKYSTEVCNQCYPKTISEGENAVASYVATLTESQIVRSDRTLIRPFELDILLPDSRLAIEYCGLYYHSVANGKHWLYHQFKLKKCREQHIRLLTIFEDEWILKRPIVESMIQNACGKISQKLNGRQCTVRNITVQEASDFLSANHIQGRGRSIAKYGLVHQNELVSVMTFTKGDISHRSKGWEINRFATKLNATVRGGASRLFKAFIAEHQPDVVTSFADLRWGDGKVYGNLGFKWIGDTMPNYWYTKGFKRYHRYALRKTADDPKDQTEFQLREAEGWNRIYDCGHAKWIWTAPELSKFTMS